jgi:hypothetical protein
MSLTAGKPGDLEKVARGDTVVYVDLNGRSHRKLAEAAGPQWITVGGAKFARANGCNVSGVLEPYICTVEAWEEHEERSAISDRLRPWGLHPSAGQKPLSLERLRQLGDLATRWERADAEDLPAYLRDNSFSRSGCLVIEDESWRAARERGRAAETADEAALALREGEVTEARNLLDSARGYLDSYKGWLE